MVEPSAVDKVLQALRDGASAAAGPAQEGFRRVCEYRATEAATYLAVNAVFAGVLILVALVMAYLIVKKRREGRIVMMNYHACWGEYNEQWKSQGDDESNNDWSQMRPILRKIGYDDLIGMLWVAGVSWLIGLIALITLVINGPTLYATAKNPAGSVINSIVNR